MAVHKAQQTSEDLNLRPEFVFLSFLTTSGAQHSVFNLRTPHGLG